MSEASRSIAREVWDAYDRKCFTGNKPCQGIRLIVSSIIDGAMEDSTEGAGLDALRKKVKVEVQHEAATTAMTCEGIRPDGHCYLIEGAIDQR